MSRSIINYNILIKIISFIGNHRIARLVLIAGFFFLFSSNVSANNLSVSNVTMGTRIPSNNTVVIQFDLSWENSWRTKINHDAVWVTARLYNPTNTPTNKKLCQITASGLNPVGSSIGSSSNLEISVPTDRFGAFLRPLNYGLGKTIASSVHSCLGSQSV